MGKFSCALCLSEKALFHSLNSICINLIKVHGFDGHLSFHGWINTLIHNAHGSSAKLFHYFIPADGGLLNAFHNHGAACSARGGCLLALPYAGGCHGT